MGRTSSPAAPDTALPSVTIRLLRLLPFALALLCSARAEAHDPSAWGGLFRSRDHGARWLPVNEGRFIGGALGFDDRRVKQDLERLESLLDERGGRETGAWRGEQH